VSILISNPRPYVSHGVYLGELVSAASSLEVHSRGSEGAAEIPVLFTRDLLWLNSAYREPAPGTHSS
jgi:hypothetical protein